MKSLNLFFKITINCQKFNQNFYTFYRFLASMAEEDPNRQPILQLLTEMYAKQPRIGYHMLYFLKVG